VNRRPAFTLIEVLIVVVILAILAAALIPLFADTTADAKNGAAMANLRTLRSQIGFYKAQHQGQPPDAALARLLIKTDINGNAGSDFGPYLQLLPVNPFTGKTTVTATSSNPPAAASSGADRGWLYHAATGNVWLDEAGYLDK
jgi:prepilin-type N-terminal cleavage/methylation domain-containing protein